MLFSLTQPRQRADNHLQRCAMASKLKATTAKKAPVKPKAKRASSYDKLLKLAPRLKPPQTWYDEQANPFQPKRSR
jgi:hypothetical protein